MQLILNFLIPSIILLINSTLGSLDEPEKVTMMDAINYLQKYGYVRHASLSENTSSSNAIEDTQTIIKRSISEFQEIVGLPKTGDLDLKTKEMLLAPRCSVTDFQAQSEFDIKWEKNDLVYTILTYTPNLSQDEIREAIAAAFAKWSAVVPLNFKEVDHDGDNVDIRIGFYRRYHGDNDPFDGSGGALAHALWPPNGIIHFDKDETWTYKNEKKILLKIDNKYVYRDLLQTATHEIGHAIGLDHVRRNDSIMKPFYIVTTDSNGNYVEPQLSKFDIDKIQDRYGPRITPSQQKQPKEKPFTRNGFYTVRRGDTAEKIADAFDITTDDLKAWNQMLNINSLNPGRYIRVIPEVKKQQTGSCPSEWTYYEKAKICLRISPNSGTFDDINLYCKSAGGTIVSIHSSDENNFIADLVNKTISTSSGRSSDSRVWIGLADPDMDEIFTWADGSDLDFLDWQPGQPDNADGNQRNVILGPLVKDVADPSEFGHWDDIDGKVNVFRGVCQTKAQISVKPQVPNTTTTMLTTTTSTTTSVPTTVTTTSLSITTITNYPSRTQTCPDNWILFENYCYQVGYSPRTWYEAEQNCRSNGAHLASIHSDLENEFLIDISAVGDLVTDPEGRDHVWIGLNDLFIKGQFEWTDGTPVDYQNWANPTQPDNFGSGLQDCAQLYADKQTNIKIVYKKWNDNDCDGRMRAYVCKKASSKFQKKQEPTVVSKCSMPWTYFENTRKCYYVGGTDSYINRNDARISCAKLGGHLASIHSDDENAFILNQVKSHSAQFESWAWLGGIQSGSDWRWEDGTAMDYTNWFITKPNGEGSCMNIYPAGRGSWNNIDCNNLNKIKHYVCSRYF